MPNLDKDFYLDKRGLRQLVNELETNIVASEYDTSVSYSVGQYCIYENNFYRCTTATTGAWDSIAWVKVIIGDELSQSGGASSVAQLEDVQLSNLSDNDLLVYDSNLTGGKLWKNAKKIVTCTKAQFDDWSANDTFPYTDCKYIVTDVNNLNTTSADIPYDSTGTDSVKDILDDNSDRLDILEYNSSSGGIDMATYTDSNPYIAPSDGYVMASSEGSSSGQIRVPIRFANGTQGPYMYMNVTGSYQIQSVFVKKGMRIGVLANTTSGFVKFYPLDSHT